MGGGFFLTHTVVVGLVGLYKRPMVGGLNGHRDTCSMTSRVPVFLFGTDYIGTSRLHLQYSFIQHRLPASGNKTVVTVFISWLWWTWPAWPTDSFRLGSPVCWLKRQRGDNSRLGHEWLFTSRILELTIATPGECEYSAAKVAAWWQKVSDGACRPYHKLAESVDDTLFQRIMHNPYHDLYHLLPERRELVGLYNIRPRHHDRQLSRPIISGQLRKRNFIYRMLFKDSY